MSAGLAICLVCGEPLDYFEEGREVSCHICGKKETGHSVCTAGHYVCDVCHREGGVDHVLAVGPQRGGGALPGVAAVQQQRIGARGPQALDERGQMREAAHAAVAARGLGKVE